jgi:hypothetical protein
MRIHVVASKVFDERWRPLWMAVEVKWKSFLAYCRDNLFPEGIANQINPWNAGADRKGVGRKPKKLTRKDEILQAFEQINITGKHGEQKEIAEMLVKDFTDYEVDSIRRMIAPRYRERKPKDNSQ